MHPLVIVALLSIFGACFATAEDELMCNCEHCDEETVIGLGEESTTHAAMYKEDRDNDGNRTICARDRFKDRTFPSVCHMLCYNHCTRYQIITLQNNDVEKHVVIAQRPNYYKLRDGVC